jgi:DNA-binding PadR family transcriptional regulator
MRFLTLLLLPILHLLNKKPDYAYNMHKRLLNDKGGGWNYEVCPHIS